MANESKPLASEKLTTEMTSQINQALHGIRFGSVEIIIHENKIVQIEKKEKLRFDKQTNLTRS